MRPLCHSMDELQGHNDIFGTMPSLGAPIGPNPTLQTGRVLGGQAMALLKPTAGIWPIEFLALGREKPLPTRLAELS